MEDQLYRALAVLRVVVLVNAIALNLWRRDNFQHPVAGVVAVVVATAWTGFAIWAYRAEARRTVWLLGADLAVAAGLILASPAIKGDGLRATIPGFWVMGALIAWAIHWHWKGGLAAAAVLSAADLVIRDHVTQANYGNVFLLLLGGPIIGYACQNLQRMAAERDAAQRAAAAAEERTRLARAVHDGVLQVLALAQRRGRDLGAALGGERGAGLTELGRLAGEQEAALRRLIRQQDAVAPAAPAGEPAGGDPAQVDLAAALEALETRRTSVAVPAGRVLVDAPRAEQLVAVAAACLANVAAHVGEDAPAWLLLDVVGGDLVLTVRDEGPGIPDGRLATAAAEGRLGVAESIRGRIADLGGTAELLTGPGGTEWELTVPRR